jgi:hypothetical protein
MALIPRTDRPIQFEVSNVDHDCRITLVSERGNTRNINLSAGMGAVFEPQALHVQIRPRRHPINC